MQINKAKNDSVAAQLNKYLIIVKIMTFKVYRVTNKLNGNGIISELG